MILAPIDVPTALIANTSLIVNIPLKTEKGPFQRKFVIPNMQVQIDNVYVTRYQPNPPGPEKTAHRFI